MTRCVHIWQIDAEGHRGVCRKCHKHKLFPVYGKLSGWQKRQMAVQAHREIKEALAQ